jgi:hypothetical protein
MPRYYYGTVSALAWILNHYFYGGLHYSWLAGEFHPLRTNPSSSNPYVIYGQLYRVVVAGRERQVRRPAEARIASRRGRPRETTDGGTCPGVATARNLFEGLHLLLLSGRVPRRHRADRCGAESCRRFWRDGSNEFLVSDLNEAEFDLLLADNREDQAFVRFRGRGAFHAGREGDSMNATGLRFSSWEIAFLQQPRNHELQDRVVQCLDLLVDLVQRYTGSMFLVMIPEEELALEYLERALAALAGKRPFEESIRAGLEAYRRIRALAAEQGLSPRVTELARETRDELLEMWCYATRQPGYRIEDGEGEERRRAVG